MKFLIFHVFPIAYTHHSELLTLRFRSDRKSDDEGGADSGF